MVKNGLVILAGDRWKNISGFNCINCFTLLDKTFVASLELLLQIGGIMQFIKFKKAAMQLSLMRVALAVALIVASFLFLNTASVYADYLTVQGNQVSVNGNSFTAEKTSAFLDVWEFKYTTEETTTIIKLPAGMELKDSNVKPSSTRPLIRELFFWLITQNEGFELTFQTEKGTQLDIVYGSASSNPFKFDFRF